MKILLDENFPRPLRKDFLGHECFHVRDLNWSGIRNGHLLKLAADNDFEFLVTLDQGIEYQNRIDDIRLVVVQSYEQGPGGIRPLIPKILAALDSNDLITVVKA